MKKVLALVLVMVMLFSVASVATAEGEIVNMMLGGGTPETMDPGLNSASTGSNTIRLAHAGLMGTQIVDGAPVAAP